MTHLSELVAPCKSSEVSLEGKMWEHRAVSRARGFGRWGRLLVVRWPGALPELRIVCPSAKHGGAMPQALEGCARGLPPACLTESSVYSKKWAVGPGPYIEAAYQQIASAYRQNSTSELFLGTTCCSSIATDTGRS